MSEVLSRQWYLSIMYYKLFFLHSIQICFNFVAPPPPSLSYSFLFVLLPFSCFFCISVSSASASLFSSSSSSSTYLLLVLLFCGVYVWREYLFEIFCFSLPPSNRRSSCRLWLRWIPEPLLLMLLAWPMPPRYRHSQPFSLA